MCPPPSSTPSSSTPQPTVSDLHRPLLVAPAHPELVEGCPLIVARHLPRLPHRLPLLTKSPTRLQAVLRLQKPVVQGALERYRIVPTRLQRAVGDLFARPHGERTIAQQPIGPLEGGRQQFRLRHDLVDQTDALRLRRR